MGGEGRAELEVKTGVVSTLRGKEARDKVGEGTADASTYRALRSIWPVRK